MWRKFRLWLSQFNPVALWREEKRLDREAQILVVQELASALREQAAVATKALDLSHRFLSSFETDDTPPNAYVVRPEDEVKAAAERFGVNLEDFDSDTNPFSYY